MGNAGWLIAGCFTSSEPRFFSEPGFWSRRDTLRRPDQGAGLAVCVISAVLAVCTISAVYVILQDWQVCACSAGTAAATPQRPSTPCSASARASDPPTTATSSDNAADPGRPGASHRPPSDPPQSGPSAGPPACLTALETNFPKSKSSRTSPGTVQEPCLERRRPINIWCDRKQREKPFTSKFKLLGEYQYKYFTNGTLATCPSCFAGGPVLRSHRDRVPPRSG